MDPKTSAVIESHLLRIHEMWRPTYSIQESHRILEVYVGISKYFRIVQHTVMPRVGHAKSTAHSVDTALDAYFQLNTRNEDGFVSRQERPTSVMTPSQCANVPDVVNQEFWSQG
jgi:hypothetical protein